MSTHIPAAFDAAIANLPRRYVGPGGAIAVLREGEVLAKHVWGWADAERRIPFTAETMTLVCSITKQFTCALMLDQFPDPSALDGDVRRMMPLLGSAAPDALRLAHNQSGLRDYWATAMLCGAPIEGRFTDFDARRLIARTSSLQFRPGTRYSYCNQNFRILSDIIQERAGRDYAQLLRERILVPAGMPRARLGPDTSNVPGGTVGYEGTVESGFRPAVNNIIWTGDAGLACSIEDMIAWEQHIDATWDDQASRYRRQAAPVHFADGRTASYGFGLSRMKILGREATGHGGGLRGWRSFRFYIPSERISVACLFNHMADPRAAALDALAALFGEKAPPAASAPAPDWSGRYIEPETGLALRVEPAENAVKLHFAPHPDLLGANGDGSFGTSPRLSAEGGAVRMQRPLDNIDTTLTPVSGTPGLDVAGTYRSTEYGAELTVINAGGGLYAACSGELGIGAMQALLPHAQDIWLMPCPRALDHSAPGDWTLAFRRGADGEVTGIEVGCWLARHIDYERVA